MFTNLTTANDNNPVLTTAGRIDEVGDQVQAHQPNKTGLARLEPSSAGGLIYASKYSSVMSGTTIERPKIPGSVSAQQPTHNGRIPKRKRPGPFGISLWFLIWILAIAAIARFAGGTQNNTLVGENLLMATGGLGLVSLILAAMARRRDAKILHSMAAATACVCAASIAWYYWQQSDVKAPLEFMAMGISGTCLVLAMLWRTPFLLHLSLLAALGWSGYSFINSQVSELIWVFPALWSLQMFAALDFRIGRTISLTIISGLVWIAVNAFLLT